MMGSPMVLLFILPLLAVEYLFTGFSDLIGIDFGNLAESFDMESFQMMVLPFEIIIDKIYQMLG